MAVAVGRFSPEMIGLSIEIRTSRMMAPTRMAQRAITKLGISDLDLNHGQLSQLVNHDVEMLGRAEYFPELPVIQYEGPESTNHLAYHFFNPAITIPSLKMTMGEALNFAMPAWHFNTAGTDPFSGAASIAHPWDSMRDPLSQALVRARALFEFNLKMGIPNHCFHDGDYVDLALPIEEAEAQFGTITDEIASLQQQSGVQLGWSTNQLFAIPLYRRGAGTADYMPAFVRAARQSKLSIDKAIELGAKNFVFWGGREGIYQLLGTNTKLEKDNLARFLWLNVNYAESKGFFGNGGKFLIEPKGNEPTLHQYDRDVETCMAFLRENELDKYFGFNVEVNHAYLAGNSAEHEFNSAIDAGMLRGIDANDGEMEIGWDLDKYASLRAGLAIGDAIYKNGGLHGGVINHDAKLQGYNTSDYPLTMAEAVIASQDACALGLWRAHFLAVDGTLKSMIDNKYATWTTPSNVASSILDGTASLESLSHVALTMEREGLFAGLPQNRAEAMTRTVDLGTVSLQSRILRELADQGIQ